MWTHEHVSNASDTSSLPEDSEFSDSSSDRTNGASKRTHLYTSNRRIDLVVVAAAQDDFIIPPSHVKKLTSSKSSTKDGGRKNTSEKMLVNKF
jgi:hypothetical protein